MTNNLDPRRVIAQAGPWNNKPKINSLQLIGRRWFQCGPCNTYHTVEVTIDGRFVWKSARAYGYGEQYEQTAAAWLQSQGYLKLERYENGGGEQLWQYCKDHGIEYRKMAIDVPRKQDL